MSKQDPGRAWDIAMDLLAEREIERIEQLSDAELADELRACGFDTERLPSAERLLSKVQARDGGAVGVQAQPAAGAAPRVSWKEGVAWLAAAALAAGVVAVLVLRRSAPVAGPDTVPRPDDAVAPSGVARAADLRDEAERACAVQDWSACARDLDEAARADPAGDQAPRVVQMRRAITLASVPPAPAPVPTMSSWGDSKKR